MVAFETPVTKVVGSNPPSAPCNFFVDGGGIRGLSLIQPTEDLKSFKNGTMEDGRRLFCNVEQSIAEEDRCMICRKIG